MMEIANLETDCNELIDKNQDEGLFTGDRNDIKSCNSGEPGQNEVEEIVDPDDPMYGLNERLVNMGLDEESKKIVIERLLEANDKVKTGLLDR